MKKNVGKLTLTGLMTAAAVVLVCISNALPTTKLALLGAAGFAGCLVVAENGPWYGLAMFAAASLLSILFAPLTGMVYAVFFGWYPSAKCVIERVKKRGIEWLIKIAVFSAVFAVVYLLLPQVIASGIPSLGSFGVFAYFIACAAFVLYDICLSMMISYYLRVIYPKIRK